MAARIILHVFANMCSQTSAGSVRTNPANGSHAERVDLRCASRWLRMGFGQTVLWISIEAVTIGCPLHHKYIGYLET